jgi:hypothetical protein
MTDEEIEESNREYFEKIAKEEAIEKASKDALKRDELKELDSETKRFKELIGKKIVNVGMTKACVEGGLAFDTEDGKRYILGFTELGCWTEDVIDMKEE